MDRCDFNNHWKGVFVCVCVCVWERERKGESPIFLHVENDMNRHEKEREDGSRSLHFLFDDFVRRKQKILCLFLSFSLSSEIPFFGATFFSPIDEYKSESIGKTNWSEDGNFQPPSFIPSFFPFSILNDSNNYRTSFYCYCSNLNLLLVFLPLHCNKIKLNYFPSYPSSSILSNKSSIRKNLFTCLGNFSSCLFIRKLCSKLESF